MKLSRTAQYAISVCAHISKQKRDSVVIGHKAAKELGLPEGFLLRILVALSRSRILHSIKGPNGGYKLAREPKDVTMLEIVEAVEGPMHGVVLDENSSALGKKLEKIVKNVSDNVRDEFNKVTLASLVK